MGIGRGDDLPPSNNVPWVSHEVIKLNRVGRRQKRTLSLSSEGIKNMSGSSLQWYVGKENIHSLEFSETMPTTLRLRVITNYTYEAESPETAAAVRAAFEQLQLGMILRHNADDSTTVVVPGPPGSASVCGGLPAAASGLGGAGGAGALDFPSVGSSAAFVAPASLRGAADEAEPVDEYVSPIPRAGAALTPDHFELLKTIGVGSFGKVFLVRKKDDGRLYAMKVLKKEELIKRGQVEHTLTEHEILAKLRHPFMVSLHYSFQTAEKLYMVLDFAQGGELFYHLGKARRFPEVLAVFYAAEIILALNYLHRHDIIYRDLKPENILLDKDGHVLVTDFGLAKVGITSIGGDDAEGVARTFCGTPEYLAPEVLMGRGHGKAVDWWSVGVLLYEMLTGSPPFFAENRQEMYRNVMKGQISFPSTVSADAQDFLRKILVRRPQERLGSGPGGIAEIQRHPLFKGIDWTALELKQAAPPFKPRIREGDETHNFDPEFTRQCPRDSASAPSGNGATDDTFQDFGFSR